MKKANSNITINNNVKLLSRNFFETVVKKNMSPEEALSGALTIIANLQQNLHDAGIDIDVAGIIDEIQNEIMENTKNNNQKLYS